MNPERNRRAAALLVVGYITAHSIHDVLRHKTQLAVVGILCLALIALAHALPKRP